MQQAITQYKFKYIYIYIASYTNIKIFIASYIKILTDPMLTKFYNLTWHHHGPKRKPTDCWIILMQRISTPNVNIMMWTPEWSIIWP